MVRQGRRPTGRRLVLFQGSDRVTRSGTPGGTLPGEARPPRGLAPLAPGGRAGPPSNGAHCMSELLIALRGNLHRWYEMRPLAVQYGQQLLAALATARRLELFADKHGPDLEPWQVEEAKAALLIDETASGVVLEYRALVEAIRRDARAVATLVKDAGADPTPLLLFANEPAADLDSRYWEAARGVVEWASIHSEKPATDVGEEWMPASGAVGVANEKGYDITLGWISKRKDRLRTRPRQLPGNHKLEVEMGGLARVLFAEVERKTVKTDPDEPDN